MRRRDNDDRVSGLWAVLTDPVRSLPIAVALLALALMLWWFQRGAEPPAGPPPAPSPATGPGPVAAPGRPGEYLFCFWNVENLFDDHDDRRLPIDEPYDNWFANDPAARGLEFQHLSEALVQLNGGKGPDILACVEVESVRAAEMLRDALNGQLADPALH